VQILDEDEEGLDLALAQEEPLDTIEDALATLRGIEPFPPGSSTGTSRRAKRAGSQGSSGRSRARSLPVTFSRIRRLSSRASIWK